MRRLIKTTACAVAFVTAGVVPVAGSDSEKTAHVPEKPHVAAAKPAPATEHSKTGAESPAPVSASKPKPATPADVAENIMKAIREYGAATAQPRRAAPAARPRTPRYRVEWPAPRYTVTWPEDEAGVTLVWP